MKYLTIWKDSRYNMCKSRYPISQIPTCLSTNPGFLEFQGLASKLARLVAIVWLSFQAVSLLPLKLRLNKTCPQSRLRRRVMLLHTFLPKGRSLDTLNIYQGVYANVFSAINLYTQNVLKHRKILSICVFAAVLYLVNIGKAGAEVCTGRFVNPVTDVCWECLFPITLGSTELASGSVPDTSNPSSPICTCGTPIPRIGLAVGFWEPTRLVDVTKRPFCFVNLGGMTLDPGIGIGTGKAPDNTETTEAIWHVHWYVYPLLYWLNLITDFACLEASGFDISYVTELDPLWQDDELTFLLNPEAILFANPIAQAACAADCIASTAYLPLDPLFWCAGCQGGMYPMNGRVQGHIGSIQSSLLATERMTYKLHREGLAWGTSGELALCAAYPMPIIKKSQYRSQLINPIPTTGDSGCAPFGKSSIFYESNKEIPIIGEDFGYLLWRKRNCCAL